MLNIKAISALNFSFLQVAVRNVIRHRRLDHEIDYSEVSHDPGPSLGGGSESLLRRCVGLSTVIIIDGTHNRSER